MTKLTKSSHQNKLQITPPKTNIKQPFESMYLLLELVIFHCHVSFQGGNPQKGVQHHSNPEIYVWNTQRATRWAPTYQL